MRRARSCLQTTMLRAAAAAAAFVSSACADDVPTLVSGGESASGSSTASMTSGSSSTSLASSTSTGPADDTTGTTGTTSTGEPEVIFLPELDVGGLSSFECDIFAQDCPADQKCMPWANDGGSYWNAWGCKPLADDPVGIDEVCHVQGSSTTGIDDCEIGAMCWDVDPKTNQGACTPFCVNTQQDPLCDDPQRQCRFNSDSTVWLCLPSCNPIAQDCPRGQACYPVADYWWACGPDASGGGGAYGEPCEFVNVCDPGLICVDVSYVPPGLPCEGAGGCCTEVCDLDDPLGDLQCAGAAEGQTCQLWYEEGEPPPEYEEIGVCAMPQ